MIDEKKLIEELSKNSIFEKVTVGEETVYDIINRQPKVGEWIPCSERLPEVEQMVLATEEEGVIFCTYEYFYGYGYGFYPIHGNVTAWMPLPEPYREKVKE